MSWLQHQTKTLFGGSPQASVRLAQNVGTSAPVAGARHSGLTIVTYISIAGLTLPDMTPCSQCLQTTWWRCHVGLSCITVNITRLRPCATEGAFAK